MKALFFLNSLTGGGAERVCINLARQLHKLNIESDFITIYDRAAQYEIPEYIHVYSLKIENQPGQCFRIMMAVPKVNRYISDQRYVLITAHVQPSLLLAALTKVRKKTLYVIHSRVNIRRSWLIKIGQKFFLSGKKLVTVSRGIEKEVKKEYEIEDTNVVTIYNPGGADYLQSEETSISPHTRPYILVIGRLVEVKGPLTALDLYYEGRFYEQVDLIYLGVGPLEKELRKQIVEYGMQEYVFLKGFQKDPGKWLRNAALVLSCSNREGLPMNLVEALICGTPVVAADCDYGPNEILTDELEQYLIDPEKEREQSIQTVTDALDCYPEISEKYYAKFGDELIARTYLKVWMENFGQ